MNAIVRVLITATALAVATILVPGIELRAGTALSRTLTLIVVALITGVVSMTPRPYARGQGYAFYVLWLGAASLALNALLLWLASWVAGQLTMPFHVTGFWPAAWGALIVASVTCLAGWLGDYGRRARITA